MSKSSKWLQDHENIEREVQNLSKSFNERSRFPKSSSSYIKLTNSIRAEMNKLNVNINSLAQSLDESSSSLTYLEKKRRTDIINQLRTNQKKFDQMLLDESSSSSRDALLVDFEGASSIVSETNETLNVSSNQLLSQHDRIIADQDRGLETLSHIVRNQKRIATSIGNEVERQNEMIDSMGDKMENMNERLIKSTRNIKIVSRKSATCGIWLIIFFLLIAIIVIAAIPKP